VTLSPEVRERRRKLLIEIGEELYGERWQRAMSRVLEVPQSYLSAIVSDGRPMSYAVATSLRKLCLREVEEAVLRETKLLGWAMDLKTDAIE
jgi:hypothetical protein